MRLRFTRDRLPWVSIAIVVVFMASGTFAGLLAPADPYHQSLKLRLAPPVWMEDGRWSNVLGTDMLGRDLLSRIIFGARVSLTIGVATVLVAGIVGTTVGLVAAYYGGRLDDFLIQVTDATLSVPIILLALVLGVTVGPSVQNVVISIAAILWARFSRVVRGEALTLMSRDFVAQARIAGASARRILAVHLLPNILNTLIVLFTLQVGYVIVVEASLSFLGAGVPPPQPTWGSMIAEGRQFLGTAWWVAGLPMAAICMLVLAFSLLGDWLRDRLDPQLERF